MTCGTAVGPVTLLNGSEAKTSGITEGDGYLDSQTASLPPYPVSPFERAHHVQGELVGPTRSSGTSPPRPPKPLPQLHPCICRTPREGLHLGTWERHQKKGAQGSPRGTKETTP